MDYHVSFSAQSNRDLGQVVSFLARKNPAAAQRLGDAIVDRVLALGAMPHLGPPVRDRAGIRRVIQRPWFLIYYRVDDSARTIEVTRIWDTRQNPADFRLD